VSERALLGSSQLAQKLLEEGVDAELRCVLAVLMLAYRAYI
jgi:hypothetical protein